MRELQGSPWCHDGQLECYELIGIAAYLFVLSEMRVHAIIECSANGLPVPIAGDCRGYPINQPRLEVGPEESH